MTFPTVAEFDRILDLTKKNVFLGTNAAFMGSLLCGHDFQWDFENKVTNTACTDGLTIWWSVKDFLRCDQLEKDATLVHEILHTGFLHFLRRGSRDPGVWYTACDYRINNYLIQNGYKLPNNGYWLFNLDLDKNGIMPEEEIYEWLQKHPRPPCPKCCAKPGSEHQTPQQLANQLAATVRAVQAAEQAGQAGNLPGGLKEHLNKFLEPKIPWRSVLNRWMTDLIDTEDYTWHRPNRRYEDLYLPSLEQEEGRLEHLAYFEDVSGSITRPDHVTFNSEVKYIQEVLKPKKLTLIQFDVTITNVRVFVEDEPFEDIELFGGGGTSLEPVWEWIEENKPQAAIIFSDLECAPMRPLTKDIPVIWAAIRNKTATVPFGTLIHLRD